MAMKLREASVPSASHSSRSFASQPARPRWLAHTVFPRNHFGVSALVSECVKHYCLFHAVQLSVQVARFNFFDDQNGSIQKRLHICFDQLCSCLPGGRTGRGERRWSYQRPLLNIPHKLCGHCQLDPSAGLLLV